ncbi:hypothetical protein O3P69_018400 [Scylla paramamosain]|uniref:Uncharacterized protein n=1 Tax=Scylla paramamosain TaxID=85552 RepID=A0AAW0T0X6_SCYPA
MEQYNYRIVHRPGRVHNNADALSRRPCEASCSHCTAREPSPCEASSPGAPGVLDTVCRRLRVPANTAECNERWRVAQRSDPDLAPVVRWLEASDERPSWQVVAAESPAAKCLEDWDVKLPAMLMAYRSAVHEATDHSPSQLMFGRELRLPIDLATGRPPDVDLPTVTSGFAAALQERFAEEWYCVDLLWVECEGEPHVAE